MGTAMAGAVVGAVLGAVTKNVVALVFKLLQKRFGPSNSLHQDIGYMGRELQMIVAAQEEQLLGTRDLSDEEIMFMEQMRDLAHDIEDCLDQILRSSSEGDAEAPSMKLRIMKAVGQARSSPQVASEVIEDLIVRLKEAHQRKANYNVDGSRSAGTSSSSSSSSSSFTTATTNSPADVDPVGIDKPKRDILELLNDDVDQDQTDQLKVISVVGFGGSGKSTLAKAVYDCPDIKDRFPNRAWVVASEYRGNSMGFLKALLQKLRPGPASDDAHQLHVDITNCLNTNR